MCPHTLTRRDLLRQTVGAGSALAVASALAPFAGSERAAADGAGTIKVGILHSLTSFLAPTESPLRNAEMLAIKEINAQGGVLGKKIEPIVEDTQSKLTELYPEKAKKLVVQDKVAAVFGCWTSLSRKVVLPIFEENNALLFYPVHYEGNECSKNVIYTGAVPNQQTMPAVDYLWKELGKRRFYLLGSDYIFPRVTNLVISDQLKQQYKAEPVQVKFTPLGHREYQTVVADIKAQKPDVVFSSLVGDSNLFFFDELAAAGITAKELPVCSVSMSEDELRSLDPNKMAGHLAAWSYFQTVDTPANAAFVKRYQAEYGKDQITDDQVEAAYFQVYLWKKAVEKAKSIDVDKVREALRDLELDAPGGLVKVDGKNFHTWKRFRMGKIRKDRQFEIVYQSKETIRPEPYPQITFPGWGCDWTKGGPVRGPIRKIVP